jgi:hypothetical protein
MRNANGANVKAKQTQLCMQKYVFARFDESVNNSEEEIKSFEWELIFNGGESFGCLGVMVR